MTVHEIDDKLVKELPEEMQGAVDYHQMATSMEQAGCKECVFLMDIAKDEMTHAEWIHDYLKGKGIQIPKDQEERYAALKAAHKF